MATIMKFADNIIREDLDMVVVKRTYTEMSARPEFNSNLWSEIRFVGETDNGQPLRLYKVPVRDVKIGENIYNGSGRFLTYRSA